MSNPWLSRLDIGTQNVTSLAGKEPELVLEVERYLNIFGVTSLVSWRGTRLDSSLKLPLMSDSGLRWVLLFPLG